MNQLCVFLLVLGATSACTPTDKPAQLAKTPETSKATPEPPANNCIDTSLLVYRQTALMWQNSWKWANKRTSSDSGHTVTFSRDKLQELREQSANADGVRMYYCLENEGDTIPNLALVNISDCLDHSDSVLVSDPEGGYFLAVCEAAQMTHRWRSYMEGKSPYSTLVKAYNYAWPELLLLDSITDNIFVSYGLRSLEPGDAVFAADGDHLQGNIIYVNIVHATPSLEDANHNLDFAMPCPQKCDAASPLSNRVRCDAHCPGACESPGA